MRSEFRSLDLIQNREIATAIFIEMSSVGQLLICHGCDDVEAVIVAFLVHEQREQAWALSGTCLWKLPLSGAVKSGTTGAYLHDAEVTDNEGRSSSAGFRSGRLRVLQGNCPTVLPVSHSSSGGSSARSPNWAGVRACLTVTVFLTRIRFCFMSPPASVP